MSRGKVLSFLSLLLVLAACNRDPKVQAQRYVENGNKFFAMNKFKEASIMYRRAMQKDMRFGEAYYRLGLTNLKMAAYGDAARSFIRAVELQPTNSDAMTKLADIYLVAATQDQRNIDNYAKEAKELADKLVALNKDSYDGHRILGQIGLLQKDPATAIDEFAKANKIRPNQPELVTAYFQALVGNNRGAEGEKLIVDLLSKEKTFAPAYDLLYLYYVRENRLKEGEEVLQRKVANNPANADYLLQLAAHYFLGKQRDQMEALIAKLADTKTFPQGRLQAGDFFFFRLREFDRAEKEYDAGMAASPADKAAYQKRLVELYAVTNKPDQANQMLADILKANPNDNDAIAMRAGMRLSTGNRDQINAAANDLQSLVTKTPTNHLLRFNLARALLAKNEIDAARLQLEEAIKIRPDFVAAREVLARIFLIKGDPSRALKEADGVIALDPKSLQGHLVRSGALMSLNEQDKAREELDFLTKTYPTNPDARYQVGYLAWQNRDFKTAEKVFGEMYAQNPHDSRGLLGVVETMASQNKMSEAIAEMQKNLKAEPDRRDLQIALANLEVRDKRYDDAIKIFSGLVEKEPKSSDLLFRLAETYRLKGDLNTALDLFRRASQAAPNDPQPLLQVGLLMEGTGKREQAKPIYEQVLKIQPDHPIALNNLAYIKAEEGVDLDQALTMAQRARQALPNSADVADTLGWVYIKKNLSEDAVRLFSDLTKKEPANPVFRYHLGMALMQKGDRAAAKKELQTALQSNPSQDDAAKIQDLLKRI